MRAPTGGMANRMPAMGLARLYLGYGLSSGGIDARPEVAGPIR